MPEYRKKRAQDGDIKEAPVDIPSKLPQPKDVPRQDQMFALDGAWLPSIDAALIGAKNFQELTNLRYNDGGLEGINGYSVINSTPISTYTYIKNGIHFRTNRTADSYVLVHAADSSGNGRVYVNKTAIGSTGDFSSTIGERSGGSPNAYLWADASADLDGRFSSAPNGYVAYANEKEIWTWSGEEAVPGAIFKVKDSSDTDPIDVTEKLTNGRSDSDNVVTVTTADYEHLIIMHTRPIQGIKFYVSSGNASASQISVSYWDGTAWQAVSNDTDGTSSGGATLAQTGTVTFDFEDRDTSKLKHFQERYLYAYLVSIDAGSANIYEISVNAPAQRPTNVWNGIYRQPIQAQVWNDSDSAYEDFTLHVSENSTINTPVGLILDGLTTSDYFILQFEEQIAGIKFTMLGNLINKANSQFAAAGGIKYWDGDSWENLTFVDGTLDDDADTSLATSGLIHWDPPSDEEKQTLFGTQGYAYKFILDATATGTKGGDEEIVVDLIDGIPARKEIETYKFPALFKNKLMFCGAVQNNEGNRIDYSMDSAPDVFNGDDSSMDGYQSAYIGSIEEITSGIQLYNRFGSNIYTFFLILKNSETYLLSGDGPLDYKIYPVSLSLGCPAPHTLCTAEIGQELGEAISRNVAIWVSNSGPVMFDGATIAEIRGLEKYFDSNENESVNFSVMSDFQGWFDPNYQEYNLLLATGSNTSLNKWFCYDIVRKKWFEKDTGIAEAVQCGWPCIATTGAQYVYGGLETGEMIELEDGYTWDGTNIINSFRTGDFFPSGNEWDITLLRRIKLVAKRITESNTLVKLWHYADTDATGGISVIFRDIDDVSMTHGGDLGESGVDEPNTHVSWVNVTASISNGSVAGVSFSDAPTSTLDLSIDSGLKRLIRDTNNLNQEAWAHSLRFEFESASTPKGLQPIMWGYQWGYKRKDIND